MPITISFFSPSGFEIREDFDLAQRVCYLPLDTPRNAKKFLDAVAPSLVIFTKYDLWFHFLKETYRRNIPAFLISARIDQSNRIFKFGSAIWLKMYAGFEKIFTQDEESVIKLERKGLSNAKPAGDTRYDRALGVMENWSSDEVLDGFCSNHRVIVAGSTWPDDEKLIKSLMDSIPHDQGIKLIIAPHEVSPSRIKDLLNRFPGAAKYSKYKFDDSDTLIIDHIGLLNNAYSYAYVSYVGGGFRGALHNILEPAVYGRPVFYGPDSKDYPESMAMELAGASHSVSDANVMKVILMQYLMDNRVYHKASNAASDFILKQSGATARIMADLKGFIIN